MAFDVESLVNDSIKLELGSPIIPLVEQEPEAFELAKKLGLVDYYRIIPYTRNDCRNLGGCDSPLIISIDSIIQKFFSNPEVAKSVCYLGLVYGEQNSFATGNSIGNFDTFLLGAEGASAVRTQTDSAGILGLGSIYGSGDFVPDLAAFDPRHDTLQDYDAILETVMASTQEDIMNGSPWFTIDRVNGNLEIITSTVAGQLRLIHAFGFTCFDFVEPNHIEFLSHLIIRRGLRAVLMSRASVGLNADFTVETSVIESRLSAIDEEIKEKAPLYAFMPLIWD